MHASNNPPILKQSNSSSDIVVGSLSTNSHALMVNPDWKALITRDYGIPQETLERFVGYAQHLDSSLPISFAEIHRRLAFLSKQKPDLKNHAQFHHLQEYHLSLLACCVNHPNASALLANIIPHDEAQAWLEVSLMMHANHSVQQLVALFPHLSLNSAILLASRAANTNMVYFLLERSSGFSSRDIQEMIYQAASDGNSDVFFYLQNHFPTHDESRLSLLLIIINAAHTGNTSFFDNVMGYYSQKYGSSLLPPLEALAAAANSPNKLMFSYLAGQFPRLVKSLDKDQLKGILGSNWDNINLCYQLNPACFRDANFDTVAASGDVETVRSAIEAFNLTPNKKMLWHAIDSARLGYEELVCFLIKTCHVVPDREIFHMAAKDEQLFRYIQVKCDFVPDSDTLAELVYHNQIPLFDELRQSNPDIQLTDKALTKAVWSNNPCMVKRMINEFGLQPKQADLQIGRVSNIGVARALLESILGADMDSFSHTNRGDCNNELINSHQNIFQGLTCCYRGDLAQAEQHWKKAAEHSMRHFFTFVTRAVHHPEQYHLDKDYVSPLLKVAQDVTSNLVSITEREVIYPMLSASLDKELQQLASILKPAPLLEISLAKQFKK